MLLQVQPRLRAGPEVTREAERGLGSNGTTSVNDLVNARNGNSDFASQTILADSHRLHELLEQDHTRMDWGKLLHRHSHLLSVIVDHLNVESVASFPTKADTPLVVDPDAVLTPTITPERLKTITGRDAKFGELCCRVEPRKPATGDVLDVSKPSRPLIVAKALGVSAAKRTNHRSILRPAL